MITPELIAQKLANKLAARTGYHHPEHLIPDILEAFNDVAQAVMIVEMRRREDEISSIIIGQL